MKYAYYDLTSDQFEDLIVVVCQQLFGLGVQKFAKGKDGGRDAKFIGTAERFPSQAEPWKGITIIQAKHTQGYNKTFSDGEFYSLTSKTNVLGEELPRITKLRKDKALDNYILFSNRRLSGIVETDIQRHISKASGIPIASIYLGGIEQIELFIRTHPQIVTIAGIDPIDSPLLVSPDELANIVEALSKHGSAVKTAFEMPPTARTKYDTKNKLNNMSAEYAEQQRRNYLKDTGQVQKFLAATENEALLRQYETVVEEFQLKIIGKRQDYQRFDDVMEYLANLLFGRDPVLSKNKRLTRIMLFYMYWNCDIGVSDATTN